MSHIYQPLMLKVLIQGGGRASIRDIASAFLAHDESQIDYYAEITKRMPGRVLASHGLVQREGNRFRLLADVEALSPEQRKPDEVCAIAPWLITGSAEVSASTITVGLHLATYPALIATKF